MNSPDDGRNPVTTGLGDDAAHDGERVIQDRFVPGVGDAGELAVEQLDPDTVYELVDPGPNPTRYHQILQRGPRQCTKRELDAYIEVRARNLIAQSHSCFQFNLTDEQLRSIARDVVMQNWRRQA